MVLSDVSDVGFIAIMLAAFGLAIGLVRLLGRLIDSGAPDGWADDPLDAGETGPDGGTSVSPASPDPGGPQ